MDSETVSLWYDPDGDSLEVVWKVKKGHFVETDDDRMMAKIDVQGNVLGFHVLGVSHIEG